MGYHFGMDTSYGMAGLVLAFSVHKRPESGGHIHWSAASFLMCLRPIRPDLVFPGRRAAHSKMTPRKLNGFHKELAEGVGFFRKAVELRFIVDVKDLHVVLAQP